MSPRLKKLLGSFGVIVFVTAYAWSAAVVADWVPKVAAAQFVYFALAGVLWGVPLLPLIKWMNREPAVEPDVRSGA